MPKTAPAPKPKRAVQPAIHYRILANRPEAHLFTVECTVPDPDPTGEIFALPAWIPGSYLIRDFARHVVSFVAHAGTQAAKIKKTAVDQWHVTPPAKASELRVLIEVYAWDLSVRGAHLDTRHAFFNGTSVFLRVLGRESHACTVDLERPQGNAYTHWRVATALPRAGATALPRAGATALPRAGATALHAFGRYQAANYADLIDHPVEMGAFDLIEFSTRGVQHDFALTGHHRADLIRLRRDIKRICTWQLDFWGKPNPTARYTFLTTCVGEGYGGLEHRASTALLCKRDDLPKPEDAAISEGYRNFLGLVSHEYFHTWLVKRIQPTEFADPLRLDLQRQNPTELLWLFEGFTSYYDDLALMRCGLIRSDEYLACLSKTITTVMGTPGRLRQSVADSSFDAWIKYYKPDENTPNATVSYYAKGALIALALDLSIRLSTNGKNSLDDLMRRLWREHGQTGTGVGEEDIRRIAAELAPALKGRVLDKFFADALHGTSELPLSELLASHGIQLTFTGGGGPSLGVRMDKDEPRIACALDGGAAQKSGLAGGDVLVALNGLRITTQNFETLLARHRVGEAVSIHAFRRDELGLFEAQLAAAPNHSCLLARLPKTTRQARRLQQLWLPEEPTASR